MEHLGIRIFEQLRVALTEALADRLLYARITDLALPRWLFPEKLIYCESKESATGAEVS